MRKRKHMFSVEEKKFEEKDTGDFMLHLDLTCMSNYFWNCEVFLRQMATVYQQIPVACFEANNKQIKNFRYR